MIDVIDGGKHPDWVRDMLEDCSRANTLLDMDYNGSRSESVIALEDGIPVGIVSFDREPSFRINLVHAYPGHDDSIEPMVKSIMAMAAFQGKDSVTVHSIDKDGKLNGIFYSIGFRNTADNPCNLRESTIHMRYRFRGSDKRGLSSLAISDIQGCWLD